MIWDNTRFLEADLVLIMISKGLCYDALMMYSIYLHEYENNTAAHLGVFQKVNTFKRFYSSLQQIIVKNLSNWTLWKLCLMVKLYYSIEVYYITQKHRHECFNPKDPNARKCFGFLQKADGTTHLCTRSLHYCPKMNK